jgi:hypothetical protein
MKSLRLLGRSTFKEGPRARRAVFVSVLAFLLVGGSFLPGPAVNSRQQFAARPRPVPSKVLIGAEAAKHARGRMLALPKDNPARRGYELMLERLRPYGADPDQMLAAQFATPKTRTGALKERVLGFMGDLLGTPAHAEYYQDGTFEMYLTPFESDSYDGTAEFNVYVYDSDTGAWAVSDLQLHTADDAPGNAFDASTGWNSSIALNCRPPLEHARQGPLGFFAPSVLAQTWQGIQCEQNYELTLGLLRSVRNGIGAGIGAAFGGWASRVCRYTGVGFWGCVGSAGYATFAGFVFYDFGSFVYDCRCRYIAWDCI